MHDGAVFVRHIIHKKIDMKRVNNGAVKHSAQAYLCAEKGSNQHASSCGSSCGSGDEPKKPTASCGSSCGAGEK